MEVRKVSLIVFYNENKEILLQDRTNMSKVGEEWGFFGGKIEKGETPEEAVIRETKEELSYDLQKNEFEFIGKIEFELREFNLYIIQYIFISPLKNKKESFIQCEGDSMGLSSLSKARTLKMVGCDTQTLELLEKTI